MRKRKTSISLSQEALDVLHWLARRDGLSMSGVLEQLVRQKARAEGYVFEGPEGPETSEARE